MKATPFAVILPLLLWLAIPAFAAPTIGSATINYGTNQITITGSDFCPRRALPRVTFDTANLVVSSACSQTSITAKLPVFPAGSYLLTVTNSNTNSVQFAVTYGAVGPQGPVGAAGAPGAPGSPGSPGPTGPPGAFNVYDANGQLLGIALDGQGTVYVASATAVLSFYYPNPQILNNGGPAVQPQPLSLSQTAATPQRIRSWGGVNFFISPLPIVLVRCTALPVRSGRVRKPDFVLVSAARGHSRTLLYYVCCEPDDNL